MRLPSKPDALENQIPATSTVSRDPSYPDRARIDSDVRAFLRPVSTPWIVFDRDSRCDDFAKSALRVGAVFASSPSLRPEYVDSAPGSDLRSSLTPEMSAAFAAPVRMTDAPAPAAAAPSSAPMFPPSSGSPESVVEPSSLVVASDVMPDSSTFPIDDHDRHPSESLNDANPFASRSLFTGRGRIAAIASACAGVLAIVGVSAVVLGGGARAQVKATATTQAIATPAVAPAASPPPAPETVELDAPVAPAAPTPPEPAASASEPKAAATPADPKKRFGKLTIKADAKHKNVWFDGKRMLGSGQRSFLVFCGMHTVAVNDKADTKDVEIPCNGEYSVGK